MSETFSPGDRIRAKEHLVLIGGVKPGYNGEVTGDCPPNTGGTVVKYDGGTDIFVRFDLAPHVKDAVFRIPREKVERVGEP